MRKLLLTLLFLTLTKLVLSQGYSTCANAVAGTALSNGCIINQNFPGSVNMSGLCVGGSNPAVYIKFVAGNCSQFIITPSGNFGSIGSQILTTGCAGVAGSLQCHDNVISGSSFSADCHDVNGNYLLTSGTTYILRLWGSVGTSTFKICYESNKSEEQSNECSGALGLGTSPTQFYNGGDCSFTGSAIDLTTSDPVASGLCAGSLENTQWIKFIPISGVTSFQINGTGINCTGGGCGFQFGIFSGSCSSLLSEGCYGNKVCSGGQSTAGPTNTSSTDGFSISWSGTTPSGFTATITRTGGLLFTGTETFYLVMDGNANADCQYTLQGTNIQALPIELLRFDVYNRLGQNIIEWVCATERSNDYFTLERSSDGLNWESISTINGAGNSVIKTSYSYSDGGHKNSYNYYRLKQTDFNGVSEFFKIISIDNSVNSKKVIRVINIYGVECNDDPNKILIYQFSDGTYQKVFRFE